MTFWTRKATSKALLLDVNVLLALAWPNHQFHRQARARLAKTQPWATCAITELALIRLYLTPAVVHARKSAAEALAILSAMAEDDYHEYWSELPELTEARGSGAFARVLGHHQVNDAYLLELARRHGGRLLTFDRRLEALGPAGVAEVLAS